MPRDCCHQRPLERGRSPGSGGRGGMKGFFSVKNWAEYQHYKDRDPTWIKLYNRLLDNYDFGLLPDATKWHLIGIFLLASRYKNKIPADAGWVATKIGATTVVDLTLLEKCDFIELDH